MNELLREASLRSPSENPERRLADEETETAIHIVLGDFSSAIQFYKKRAKTVEAIAEENDHLKAIEPLVRVHEETGDMQRAGSLAKAYLSKRDAWVHTPEQQWDPTGLFLTILVHAGVENEGDAESERARHIDGMLRAPEPGLTHAMVWTTQYATDIRTPADATIALAGAGRLALPPDEAGARRLALPRSDEPADRIAMTGSVFALAGRPDEAIPYLEASTRACNTSSRPFDLPRAHLHLGLAREQKGDIPAACAEYAAVLAQWGSAKPRSLTAEDARKRATGLGCPETLAGAPLVVPTVQAPPTQTKPTQTLERTAAQPTQSASTTAFLDAVRPRLPRAGACVPLGAGTPRATFSFSGDGIARNILIEGLVTREVENCIRGALTGTRIPPFAAPDSATMTVDVKRAPSTNAPGSQ